VKRSPRCKLREPSQLAQAASSFLGGPCYTLRELKAQELHRTVRDELEG